MSNHHLRDKTISLKAKGLLSQMLSLPNDWDYTLRGLAAINKESIDAVRTAIHELETAGYVVRSRVRDERGLLRGCEYFVYEYPHTEDSDVENRDDFSVPPVLETPVSDSTAQENPTQLNKEIPIITNQYYIDKDGNKNEIDDKESKYYDKLQEYQKVVYYKMFDE